MPITTGHRFAASLLTPEIFRNCASSIAEYYVSPIGEVLKSSVAAGDKGVAVADKRHSRQGSPRSRQGQTRSRRYLRGGFGHRVGRGERPDARLCPAPRLPPPGPILPKISPARFDGNHEAAAAFHPVLLAWRHGQWKNGSLYSCGRAFPFPGKPSLILVPEIGLTPQLTDRFSKRRLREDGHPSQFAHEASTHRRMASAWPTSAASPKARSRALCVVGARRFLRHS